MERPYEFTLITGACSGIGEAVAGRIAAAGRVILHGRNMERLEALRLRLPNPDDHLTWCQEFAGKTDAAESLISLLSGSSAVITGFIHCAQEHRVSSVAAADPPSVLKAFRINYFSATAIIRALLRRAVNRGALRAIVFVSSIASRFGTSGYSTYAATKGALDSLSRSLAAELGPTVRVNSILPGFIGRTEGYIIGPGGADDIAAMSEYLIAEHARWITGQQFVIDGGKTAH
jgi:NAD(P)-dependent dehydrogenase (short-subunit alcohol dehydrogenase family)